MLWLGETLNNSVVLSNSSVNPDKIWRDTAGIQSTLEWDNPWYMVSRYSYLHAVHTMNKMASGQTE